MYFYTHKCIFSPCFINRSCASSWHLQLTFCLFKIPYIFTKLVMTGLRVDTALRLSEGVVPALPVENKLFLVDFMGEYGEKAFVRSVVTYPSTRYVNLLRQWNHVWYSDYSWSHLLVKFIIIHCCSPRSILCAGHIGIIYQRYCLLVTAI